MSNPIRSAYKAGATTPAEVLAFHTTHFGGARMEATGDEGDDNGTPEAERPEGVSESEWESLGDPGKRALVRERERATKAEQALAAARAARPKPTPPKGKDDPKPEGGEGGGDIASIVQQAVAAAIAPFQQAQEQRDAESAARRVAEAVTTAATGVLHDASDALAAIDLSELTDGEGRPDADKIKTALDDLVQRKPHLAKPVDARRRAAQGAPVGGGAPNLSLDDKVKAALAQMQATTGISLPKRPE